MAKKTPRTKAGAQDAASTSRRRRATPLPDEAGATPAGIPTTADDLQAKLDATPELSAATETTAQSDAGAGPGPSREEIARRAYFRFLARGGASGHEAEDWFEAERELLERR